MSHQEGISVLTYVGLAGSMYLLASYCHTLTGMSMCQMTISSSCQLTYSVSLLVDFRQACFMLLAHIHTHTHTHTHIPQFLNSAHSQCMHVSQLLACHISIMLIEAITANCAPFRGKVLKEMVYF